MLQKGKYFFRKITLCASLVDPNVTKMCIFLKELYTLCITGQSQCYKKVEKSRGILHFVHQWKIFMLQTIAYFSRNTILCTALKDPNATKRYIFHEKMIFCAPLKDPNVINKFIFLQEYYTWCINGRSYCYKKVPMSGGIAHFVHHWKIIMLQKVNLSWGIQHSVYYLKILMLQEGTYFLRHYTLRASLEYHNVTKRDIFPKW